MEQCFQPFAQRQRAEELEPQEQYQSDPDDLEYGRVRQ
jgi:hypothetical protein